MHCIRTDAGQEYIVRREFSDFLFKNAPIIQRERNITRTSFPIRHYSVGLHVVPLEFPYVYTLPTWYTEPRC